MQTEDTHCWFNIMHNHCSHAAKTQSTSKSICRMSTDVAQWHACHIDLTQFAVGVHIQLAVMQSRSTTLTSLSDTFTRSHSRGASSGAWRVLSNQLLGMQQLLLEGRLLCAKPCLTQMLCITLQLCSASAIHNMLLSLMSPCGSRRPYNALTACSA